MPIRISSSADVDAHVRAISDFAKRTQTWLASQKSTGIQFLKAIKFDAVGWHPVEGHALNCIEQVNQTFTYLVALEGTRFLLTKHPDAGGFDLAPGAHMAMALDIMSVEPGLVGAETFSAVDPRNNRKLAKDLDKLARHTERFRYLFFASPLYPGFHRRETLERPGIEVWSVQI